MKKCVFLSFISAALFIACGDDSSTSVKENEFLESSSSIIEEPIYSNESEESSSSAKGDEQSISSEVIISSSSKEIDAKSSSSTKISSSSQITKNSSSSIKNPSSSSNKETSSSSIKSSSSEKTDSSSSEDSSSSLSSSFQKVSSSSVMSSSSQISEVILNEIGICEGENANKIAKASDDNFYGCFGSNWVNLGKNALGLYKLTCTLGETMHYKEASWSCENSKFVFNRNQDSSTVTGKDNHTYKTIWIGTQNWLADNVSINIGDSSFCNQYNSFPGGYTCEKAGRYYKWADAQTVCPNGFHLPDTTEWMVLRDFIIADMKITLEKTSNVKSVNYVAKHLKSTDSEYSWIESNDNFGSGKPIKKGIDSYGFNAYPLSYRDTKDYYGYDKFTAYFWTSNKNEKGKYIHVTLNAENEHLKFGSFSDNLNPQIPAESSMNVRCVMD